MKCLFCPTINLEKVLYTSYDFKCIRCGSSFYYDASNKLYSWRFFKRIKSRLFIIEWVKFKNTIIVSQIAPKFEEVVELDGSANINPHNIAAKLPILIVFS